MAPLPPVRCSRPQFQTSTSSRDLNKSKRLSADGRSEFQVFFPYRDRARNGLTLSPSSLGIASLCHPFYRSKQCFSLHAIRQPGLVLGHFPTSQVRLLGLRTRRSRSWTDRQCRARTPRPSWHLSLRLLFVPAVTLHKVGVARCYARSEVDSTLMVQT